jgi:very-short-patch-repair endonuclease
MKISPQIFMQFCTSMGLAAPVAELQFEPLRRWRFDYSWPEAKIALEVEGGIWSGGRHTRGKGFIGDRAKYNHAARLGWRVLRVQPKELMTLATVQLVKESKGGTNE